MSAEARLAALGITLPPLRTAAGSYVGSVRTGDLLFLSGQGAEPHVGRLGDDLDVAAGRAAARDCMRNLLAQTRAALGTLDAVERVVKVLGFVACTPEFRDQPAVIDGGSALQIGRASCRERV